jgi:hypothetical protein
MLGAYSASGQRFCPVLSACRPAPARPAARREAPMGCSRRAGTQPVARTFRREMSALKLSWSIGVELYCQKV